MVDKYTETHKEIENRFDLQNKKSELFHQNFDKNFLKFTHELIEQVSLIRDESLSAQKDLRQDIERLSEEQKIANSLIKELNSMFTKSGTKLNIVIGVSVFSLIVGIVAITTTILFNPFQKIKPLSLALSSDQFPKLFAHFYFITSSSAAL
ncbi:hypothetical protein [Shewanella woodyi]|uniref:hypothetical protein n=1 Tax=Shewanella woodyi TaxID=60961 RepID=UPI0007F94783|nr:hypothetical protein [Shewanella woodyi]